MQEKFLDTKQETYTNLQNNTFDFESAAPAVKTKVLSNTYLKDNQLEHKVSSLDKNDSPISIVKLPC